MIIWKFWEIEVICFFGVVFIIKLNRMSKLGIIVFSSFRYVEGWVESFIWFYVFKISLVNMRFLEKNFFLN